VEAKGDYCSSRQTKSITTSRILSRPHLPHQLKNKPHLSRPCTTEIECEPDEFEIQRGWNNIEIQGGRVEGET